MDENLSWYLNENIDAFGSNESKVDDEDFQESNKMHGEQFIFAYRRHNIAETHFKW